MNNEELNNTTTEELENTAAETEEEVETQEGDLIGTIIGTVVVAGITALCIKFFKKKPKEPVEDGQPKKKRWRRKLEEHLLEDGEVIVSKAEYEELLKLKEAYANQA